MFGLTTRGSLDANTQLEFERLYARLTEFLGVAFNEDGSLITPNASSRLIGEVINYAGSTVPDGWLLCDGSQVSRVTYKGLFEAVGTTYGAGNGTTTFNLPDCRGRFTLGKAASSTGSVLGETGGSLDHTHSGGSHTHTFSGSTDAEGSHAHTYSDSTSSSGDHSHTQGAHQHAIGAGSTTDVGDGGTIVGQLHTATQVDIFSDSGTGTSGAHTHTAAGTTSSVGNHVHTFSGTTDGSSGTTGTANPAYIVFNKIVYTGVS